MSTDGSQALDGAWGLKTGARDLFEARGEILVVFEARGEGSAVSEGAWDNTSASAASPARARLETLRASSASSWARTASEDSRPRLAASDRKASTSALAWSSACCNSPTRDSSWEMVVSLRSR